MLLVVVTGACSSSPTGSSSITASTGSSSIPQTVALATSVRSVESPTVLTSTTSAVRAQPTTAATAAPASSPETAIAAILNPGVRFVGDCAAFASEAEIGGYCSKLLEERSDLRVYSIGPAFSEIDTFLLVERQGGGWVVIDRAPFDANSNEPKPPW